MIGAGQSALTLDSTIDRWYPDFPEAPSITVPMLLNMSSGIAESDPGQINMICADPHNFITPDDVIAIGASLPRKPFAPGQGYQYSGINTFILGRILEKVTGTDLTTLMKTHLLEPLAMTRSRFAPDGVLAPPLTHGYTEFCPPPPELPVLSDATDWSLHEAWAAGAMLSTIDDLHTWGLALGEGFGLSPQMSAARVNDLVPGSSYGLGVGVFKDPDTNCVVTLTHSGAEPGYIANVASYPTSGAVVAIMGNGDGGDPEHALTALGQALAPVMTPLVRSPPTQPCEPPATPTTTPTPIPVAAVVATPAFTG